MGWTTEPLAPGPGVILGRKGAYRGVEYSEEPFFVIDTAYYVKPKTDLDMRWLYYAIKHYKLGQIDDGSPIPLTTRSAVYVRPLQIPSPEEQRTIAHILGSLDNKIESNLQMNRTLEKMAQAIFKSWFIDFDPVRAKAEDRDTGLPKEIADLFPDSFEESEFGEIPKGWEASTLGKGFNITMGQSPPGSTYNESSDGLPFFQGRRDFGFRYPTKRVYCSEPKRMANISDTLISVRAPVGDINMAYEDCCIGRGVAAVRHKGGNESFTYYSMRALRERFKQFEAEGTVFGSINKKQFHELPYITPTNKAIERFEDFVGVIDKQLRGNSEIIKSLTRMSDALLPKLISGELQVSKADKQLEAIG